MQITVLTAAPRGEAAPYAALALGLRAAGAQVRLAAGRAFASKARSLGLDFFPLEAAGEGACPAAREALQAEAWQACQRAGAIVYDPFTLLNGYFLARQMGVPAVAAALAPLDPTAAHPAWPLYAGPRLGAAYNRLTHTLARQAAWHAVRGPVQKFWRQRAGRAPAEPFARQAEEALPVVYGYSAHVLPRPADWAGHLHVTGYWHLPPPDDWRPSPALLDFLRAGPSPVGVALPAAATPAAVDALQALGLRGVLLDDGNLPAGLPLPPAVIRVDNVPEAWLFPRLAAVVHTGAAAVSAAALCAGVPALVAGPGGPGAAWGRLLAARGLAVLARSGHPSALAAALRALLADAALRASVTAAADLVAAEDGVARAVGVVVEAVR